MNVQESLGSDRESLWYMPWTSIAGSYGSSIVFLLNHILLIIIIVCAYVFVVCVWGVLMAWHK